MIESNLSMKSMENSNKKEMNQKNSYIKIMKFGLQKKNKT